MIPILFPSTQTKFKVSGSDKGSVGGGKGRLADAISCIITEDIDRLNELELVYPTNVPMFEELKQGGIIAVKAHGINTFSDMEPYDIYKVTVRADGTAVFNAHHVSYRLAHSFVNGIAGQNRSASSMFTYVYGATPSLYPTWSTNASGSSGGQYVYSEDTKSVWEYFFDNKYSIRTVFGFDVQFNGFTMMLRNEFGTHGKLDIRVGKNLVGGEAIRDELECFNAICPVWRKDGVKVVCNPLIVQPTTPITPIVAKLIDYAEEIENQPTAAELEAYARNYLDTVQPWLPHETMHVEIEQDHGFVCGDWANVFWGEADLVGTEMRIVQTTWNVLTESYESAEIGDLETGYVMTAEW
jgi:phage-related protein